MLLLGKGLHVFTNIFFRNLRIYEDWTHFGELGFQMVRYCDVTLDNTKERLVCDSFYNLILIQGLEVIKGSVN